MQEYDDLLNNLFDDYQPVGTAEELEVEHIAICWWRLNRVWRHENAVNRVAARDVGSKGLAWQEYYKTLDKEDEAVILQLEKAMEEIETAGEVPQDLNKRILAISPKLEPFWPSREWITQEIMGNPLFSKVFQKLVPDEHSLDAAVLSILIAIKFVKHLGEIRRTAEIEVANAQHIIPDREALDRILRYETAIERSLSRALDRLDRLQRRRKGEPVLPPVSVRLTQ